MGKAKNLKERVSSYFINTSSLHSKTKALVNQIIHIRYIIVESEIESLLLEANLIKKYNPKYNSKLTDNKAYPLIRITINDAFPAVLTARRTDDASSIYFGPYPSTKALRVVLRTLRRLFPYQSSTTHPKNFCLYHHLGLCPCACVTNTSDARREYKKTVRRIIDFLKGKSAKIIKELERERNSASRKEKFEEASAVQEKIDAIIYVTKPVHTPFEYVTNPNLREDLRFQELQELTRILRKNEVHVTSLARIECYDISNFQGKEAVASMVVLTNGEVDTSQYRRFRMRGNGPNDFAMMQEVLERRFKHREWDLPDLIIVDGGKGQISSAKEVLEKLGFAIPIIGLAKREEIIITANFTEIVLPRSTSSLQLIMRIRDEAHRFAITYHRKLRSRRFIPQKSL